MLHEVIRTSQSSIVIGHHCFEDAVKEVDLSKYSATFVITQEPIWAHYGERLTQAMHGSPPQVKTLPDGEQIKNLDMFAGLLAWLADRKADRKGLVVVLGGGVVGDLSGFVASCYMRGMDWIYFPTSLLAQQDASIGGKTAVNLPHGKNLVGHFWPPKLVTVDTSVLETLPLRQVHAGYMELVKHGMLHGEDLFHQITALPVEVDWSEQLEVLTEALKVKVRIVEDDPFETKGARRLLNLGHTLAHAVETFTDYAYLHGEAVGMGLIYCTVLARHFGGNYDWEPLHRAVLNRLPKISADQFDGKRLLDLTELDKKGERGQIPWIVPLAPGDVQVFKPVDRKLLEHSIADWLEILTGR